MKLKCRPEDFVVEEKVRLRLKRRGAYSIYRLVKRCWNTLDVIRELEARHRLHRIGRAGLKDRYSLSVQYISAPGQGPKSVATENYRLTLIGMSDKPVSRDLALGNRFAITLRSLSENEVETVRAAVPRVRQDGVPNYYDDQRFGSARHGLGFIGRKLIDGHFNGALKLLLATPSAADDSRTRRTKQYLAEHWGDWNRCLEAAPEDARLALRHLSKHRSDFKTAVKLLPRGLLELFINAYQSYLWNETLAGLLARLRIPARKVEYSVGALLFYERLAPDKLSYLRRLLIPALAPSTKFRSDRVASVAAEVLDREGLELGRLRPKVRLGGLYFKPYERAAIVVPSELELSEPRPDDMYPGRYKMELRFFLPPGSYATVVLKRLALG
ncbi:MAG: tRNA pseudouridine(13) synthase TruD [candidate division WOR-3 bacterium]